MLNNLSEWRLKLNYLVKMIFGLLKVLDKDQLNDV